MKLAKLDAQTQPLSLLGAFEANESGVGADESIAVGPSNVVITDNGLTTIRRKSGDIVATGSVSDIFKTLYTRGESSVFDPRVMFDEGSGRFFLLATSNYNACSPDTCPSHLFLAVSKTSAPASLGSSDWYVSACDATRTNATPTGRWADFPGLGVNDDAVVITMQTFPFGATATGDNKVLKIRVLRKAPLVTGAETSWVDFDNFTDPANGSLLRAALHLRTTCPVPARSSSSADRTPVAVRSSLASRIPRRRRR